MSRYFNLRVMALCMAVALWVGVASYAKGATGSSVTSKAKPTSKASSKSSEKRVTKDRTKHVTKAKTKIKTKISAKAKAKKKASDLAKAKAKKKALQKEQADRKAIREEEQKVKSAFGKAILRLRKEAMELDQIKPKKGFHPVFTRPHPYLSHFTAKNAVEALNYAQRPLTGNAYRDTYVRWHLLWIIDQARESDRLDFGPKLIKLIKVMPGKLKIKLRREWWHEPPEIANEWWRIYVSLRREIGYPPYQKLIPPPESFKHMGVADRAAAEKKWAYALELRKQFKTIYDQEAIAFNRRVRYINYVVRLYRGELMYALLKTGDPAMLALVVSEINKQAEAETGFQFDLMHYLYEAAFHGYLSKFPERVLKKASANLKKTAIKHDNYITYEYKQRNFADYAFHMIHMLADGDGFVSPKRDKAKRYGRSTKRRRR